MIVMKRKMKMNRYAITCITCDEEIEELPYKTDKRCHWTTKTPNQAIMIRDVHLSQYINHSVEIEDNE